LNLTQVVKHFGNKELDARCEVSSQDEIGELSSSFNDMADMIQDYSINLETKVERRTKELYEKNAKLQDSIEYAKMIQETILPENKEIRQIIKDYFVIWDPRDVVGGDFYWMKRFEDGFVIVVGDCTGHGVPGALMTMAVNSMLNHIVNAASHSDPAAILRELNFHLNQSLCRSSEENNIQDGLDAGVIFVANDGKMLFAGAQISLFVVKEDQIMEIKGSRHAIGCDIVKRTKTFVNHDIEYELGMSFYMATDGIKDQVGGENGLPFGKKRLFAVLKSIQNLTMEEQKNIVLSTYEEYLKGEARRDDITMLGFRI
ncbi:MAG: SpoIIE family protein phosphatase, partial [Bacillota bacterium]|nr:SpoIIE family protein phosphatase [Bacillota bacterium]